MDWKNLLFMFLGFIGPIVYGVLIGSFPDFPLDVGKFVELLVWLVGLAVGGWNARAIVGKMKGDTS